MKVGIIDADLLDHGTRHPNLALMKISGWYNGVHRLVDGEINSAILYPDEQHRRARLVTEEDICNCKTLSQLVGPSSKSLFNKLVISKVFDFSKLPKLLEEAWHKGLLFEGSENVADYANVKPRIVYGGTGFVEGLSRLPKKLPDEIEHQFPDYHLYDAFVNQQINAFGKKAVHYKDYQNYSIGFLTRGCFRRCPFCVNKNEKGVRQHSHLLEFYDPSRRYVYLWDDNFLGFIDHAEKPRGKKNDDGITWKALLDELIRTGRAFQFRQGLDIRLMTPKIAEILAGCHYHGDYIFAFDHYNQKAQIVRGLRCWKNARPKGVSKFYILCGFRCVGREVDDIVEILKRIRILMQFGMLPYIMRHEDYKKSPFAPLYIQLARWCNQPQFFKKKSFREFVDANQLYRDANPNAVKKMCSTTVAMTKFIESSLLSSDGKSTSAIASEFFDLKFEMLRDRWESEEGLLGEPGL